MYMMHNGKDNESQLPPRFLLQHMSQGMGVSDTLDAAYEQRFGRGKGVCKLVRYELELKAQSAYQK